MATIYVGDDPVGWANRDKRSKKEKPTDYLPGWVRRPILKSQGLAAAEKSPGMYPTGGSYRSKKNLGAAMEANYNKTVEQLPPPPPPPDPYAGIIDEYKAGLQSYKKGIRESYNPIFDFLKSEIAAVGPRANEIKGRLGGFYDAAERKVGEYRGEAQTQLATSKENIAGIYDEADKIAEMGHEVNFGEAMGPTGDALAGAEAETVETAEALNRARAAASTQTEQTGNAAIQHINTIASTIPPERAAALQEAERLAQQETSRIKLMLAERKGEMGQMLAQASKDAPYEMSQLRLAIEEGRRADAQTDLAFRQQAWEEEIGVAKYDLERMQLEAQAAKGNDPVEFERRRQYAAEVLHSRGAEQEQAQDILDRVDLVISGAQDMESAQGGLNETQRRWFAAALAAHSGTYTPNKIG